MVAYFWYTFTNTCRNKTLIQFVSRFQEYKFGGLSWNISFLTLTVLLLSVDKDTRGLVSDSLVKPTLKTSTVQFKRNIFANTFRIHTRSSARGVFRVLFVFRVLSL